MKFMMLLLLLVTSSPGNDTDNGHKSIPPSHEQWTELLSRHVKEDGLVDYRGFQSDRNQLDSYLETLSKIHPDPERWSQDEQIAFWINAYNAFTIDLVLKHYPLESIKDIGSAIQIPFINTPWDIKFIEIGNEKMDLNHIEHGILRKKFNEPRIHFAINCASISCPRLRKEAYTALQLEEQLNQQARDFLNDHSKNVIQRNQVSISKIFKWFKGDFTTQGSLLDYLNAYAETSIDEDADIDYLEYDWRLNDIATVPVESK